MILSNKCTIKFFFILRHSKTIIFAWTIFLPSPTKWMNEDVSRSEIVTNSKMIGSALWIGTIHLLLWTFSWFGREAWFLLLSKGWERKSKNSFLKEGKARFESPKISPLAFLCWESIFPIWYFALKKLDLKRGKL